MISFVGSGSSLSVAFILLGSCAIGYLLDSNSPVAGIIGFAVFFLIIGFSMRTYLDGRSYVLKIEMAIPLLLAGLPAYGAYYAIKNISKNFSQ